MATTTLLQYLINAVGRAEAIMRRNSSATLPPRVQSVGVKLSPRAYANVHTTLRTLGIFLFSHCVDWEGKECSCNNHLYLWGDMANSRNISLSPINS